MISQILPIGSLIRVVGQAVIDKAEALLRHTDVFRDEDLSALLAFELVFIRGLLEGRVTHNHLVEHGSYRPDVRLIIVDAPIEDLRCHIYWCAAIGCI